MFEIIMRRFGYVKIDLQEDGCVVYLRKSGRDYAHGVLRSGMLDGDQYRRAIEYLAKITLFTLDRLETQINNNGISKKV